MRKAIVIALVVLSLAALPWFWPARHSVDSTGSADEKSITVTDLAGRQVTLRQPVERIVLMRSYSMYDLAAVLGDEVEEKLVGWDSSLKNGDRDAFDKFIERCPGLKETELLGDVLRDTVSAEAVLALQPDLVIMNQYMHGKHLKSVQRLERAGVPLLYLDFSDPIRDPQRSLLLLGKVLGKEKRAKALVRWIDAELNKVLDRLETIEGPMPSLYLEAGTQGPKRYGNTFGRDEQQRAVNWGRLVAQLRCRNIADGAVSGRYGMGVIRPEFLLATDPEVIIITGADWTAFPESLRLGYDADEEAARDVLRSFTSRPGWAELSAIKNQRVHGIHTRFGGHVMSFAAAQQLAKWLYPEEFSDLDPEASLRQFHEKFMPIDYGGAWMVSLEEN